MGFRLRHGLNAVLTLGVAVACNTYNPELLLDETSDVDSSDTGNATTTAGGSGGSSSDITTTINSTASSNTGTSGGAAGGSGGSGGSGDAGGSTGSTSDTTSGGGSGGSDVNTNSTSTETATTSTTTGDGGGGSGGTGGSGTTTTSNPVNPLLIDDLEDGDGQLERPTYSGYWFTAVDTTGEGDVVPEPGEQCDPEDLDPLRDGSRRAMHVSGNWTGGDDWIAAVGFALHDSEDPEPVDASIYTGVSFYARAGDENTEAHLLLMITDVEDSGHHAIELPLTTSWQLFTVDWDDPMLIQPSWAAQVDFNPATLWKLQFQFDSETFDLWVDDIFFVEPL